MYSTDSVGNIAVYCLGLVLFCGFMGLEGAWKMVLALVAVFVVACILHK